MTKEKIETKPGECKDAPKERRHKCQGPNPEFIRLKKEVDTVQDACIRLTERIERVNGNSKSRDSVNYNKLMDKLDELAREFNVAYGRLCDERCSIDVKMKPLEPNAVPPSYASDGSAGLDFTAISHEYDSITQTELYHTGWAVEIPAGYVGLLFPKSGIFKKTSRLTNCVGVIDSDYRGEVCARFENNTSAYLNVLDGERIFKRFGKTRQDAYKTGDMIFQMVVVPAPRVRVLFTEELSETERGGKGFGQMDKPESNES